MGYEADALVPSTNGSTAGITGINDELRMQPWRWLYTLVFCYFIEILMIIIYRDIFINALEVAGDANPEPLQEEEVAEQHVVGGPEIAEVVENDGQEQGEDEQEPPALLTKGIRKRSNTY